MRFGVVSEAGLASNSLPLNLLSVVQKFGSDCTRQSSSNRRVRFLGFLNPSRVLSLDEVHACLVPNVKTSATPWDGSSQVSSTAMKTMKATNSQPHVRLGTKGPCNQMHAVLESHPEG